MSAAAGLAGSVISGIGAIQQGNAANTAGQFNAGVLTNNAAEARAAAAGQEQDMALRTARTIGTARANAGASGVDPNTGSPLAVVTDIAQRGTLDALRLRYKGALESDADLNQASIDRYQGAQAQQAGYFKAASSILTGASNFGMQSGLLAGGFG